MATKLWGSRPRRRRSADDDLFGPEYSVVRLRLSWTAVAYVCMVLCLSTRYWTHWIPFEHGWRRPFFAVLAMLVLSLLGTVAAWTAHRRDGSAINKIALLGNLIAFGLSVLAVAVVFLILP